MTMTEKATALMKLAMPPFEKFLDHGESLRIECEKAGDLTPERTVLFDQYRDALTSARGEYEEQVAKLICENLTEDEVDLLTAFYSGPAHAAVEKAILLGPIVDGIGTIWRTKVLERCPETWKMLMQDVGKWQRVNTPEDWDVIVPESPDAMREAVKAEEIDLSDPSAQSIVFEP